MRYAGSMPSKKSNATIELPLDYYHQNFCQLLHVVQQRYTDLLNEQEHRFLTQFSAASTAAQCLYVRLSGRSKSLFRLSKLQYAEIPDLLHAAQELETLNLLSINPSLATEQLLPLFTKPELVQQFKTAGSSKMSRRALDEYLIEHAESADVESLTHLDTVLAVLQEEHLPVFKLCFFGNLYQDLTEFVLRDLAIYQFEAYSLDTESRQFSDRAQLEQHLLYYACSSLSEEAVANGPESMLALSQALPTPNTDDLSLQRRVSRLRNNLARDLERQKEPELALQLYAQSDSPPARERSARIKMSAGDIDESLALCREIRLNPSDEAEAVFAQQFAQRHAKRHGRDWPVFEQHKAQVIKFQLEQTDSVELDTATQLAQDGECHFVENTLFSSVLGLALWPAVFAPIKGAFSHPFQARPHDFHHSDFVPLRADIIQPALELQLTDPAAFKEQIVKRFNHKHGTANPLVYWSTLDEQLLDKALEEIPAAHWQVIFQRLLSDLRNHRNGLPDLIYFPSGGGYELVEVKGPGDRLQDNQKRWMQFFQQHDIPHWVAQVSWLEGRAHD